MISWDCFIKTGAFKFIKIIYLLGGKAINRGILTGFNKAFIIDNDTKEALIAEDPRSADIIKPVLRGRDIKRYRAEWAGLWLIATFPGLALNIDDYPAVKRHLLSFGKARLEQSGSTLPNGTKSRKKTAHAWYELQDTCAYHEVFRQDKLMWIELVESGRFAYDGSGIYCNDKGFIMTGGSLKYLCAVLNARLIRWFFQQIAPTSGMGTLLWKKVYVEAIPIPQIPVGKQDRFIELIDTILAAKAIDPKADVSTIEAEIDLRIFELYRLKPVEIFAVGK